MGWARFLSHPAGTLRGMDVLHFPTTCVHDRFVIGSYELDICPQTDEAGWRCDGDEVDPAVAMASLFGQFDLCSTLPAMAPAEIVFVYRPAGRRGRSTMRSLPLGRWFESAPGLWLSHDGDHLLLAPSDPLVAANLARHL